jgi:tetratricopeptide (TPR) repeat protein
MPLQEDALGLAVTAASATAAAALAHCQASQLAFSTTLMDDVKAALVADPAMPMARALRGYLLLSARQREHVDAARRIGEAIVRESNAFTQREALHGEALLSWAGGDIETAVDLWEEILGAHPRDTVALRFAHFAYLYSGRSRALRDSVNRVAWAFDPDHPLTGYVYGMQAFGFEETGDYARARELAQVALARQADPWALHAFTHCCEMQDHADEGRAFLDRHAASAHASGLRNHLDWHHALMSIDAGEPAQALAVLDACLARDGAEQPPLVCDHVALALRLQLLGVDVGTRWKRIAGFARTRIGDHALIFHDAHYMLALACAGEAADAERLLESLALFSENNTFAVGEQANRFGIDLLRGLRDYAFGDHAAAHVLLRPIRRDWFRMGGSHAQRDLFDQVLIDTATRAGHLHEAVALLAERTAVQRDNANSWQQFARALAAIGETARSEAAAGRAAALRAARR